MNKKQTPEPKDWHDVGKLLGKPPIKLPKPITTQVRKLTVCPVCRSPHPPGTACKAVEASDNGYTLERKA